MKKEHNLQFRRRWRRYLLGNALGLYLASFLVIGILSHFNQIKALLGLNHAADRWRVNLAGNVRLAAGGAFAAVCLHFCALAQSTKMKSHIALLRKERRPLRRGAGDALITAAWFSGYFTAGYAILGGFETNSSALLPFHLSLPVAGWFSAIGPVEFREFNRREKLKSGTAPPGRPGDREIR